MSEAPLQNPHSSDVTHQRPRDWTSPDRLSALILAAITVAGFLLCLLMAMPFFSALAWAMALAVLFLPLQVALERQLQNTTCAALLAVALIGGIVAVPTAFVAQNLAVHARGGADFVAKQMDS